MSNFTKKQLGKWEFIFDELIFGIKFPLKESSSWFLGDKHGIIAIFNNDEILYVLGTQNISKTINNIVKGGNVGDFRKMLSIVEFNLSGNNIESKILKGTLATKIDKKISSFSFSISQAPKQHLERLSEAFNVVSDSTYGGPTVKSNISIDSLPS